ncbi:MAG: hypothetical protein U1A77_22545 [Pirellulales bacterium]
MRRVLPWIAIFAVGVLVALAFLHSRHASTQAAKLDASLAELRNAKQPASLSELERPAPADEDNAWVKLHALAGEISTARQQLTELYPDDEPPKHPLSAEDREKIGAIVSSRTELFLALDRASMSSSFAIAYDYRIPHVKFVEQLMPEIHETRDAFRVMRVHMAWQLAQGQRAEALASTLSMLRLSRLLQQNPLLIWHLTSVACRRLSLECIDDILSSGPLQEEQRRELDAELALHDSHEGYRWALVSERAAALTALEELPGAGSWFRRGFAKEAGNQLLAMVDEYLADLSQPYDQANAFKRLDESPGGGLNAYAAVVALLRPAFEAAREPSERAIAYSRALRILNALPATDSSGTPAEPPALDQLGLPPAALVDPYSLKPLIVQRTPAGWRVYSVGKNRADDGGETENLADIRAGK